MRHSGEALENNFFRGSEFEQANLQKFRYSGDLPGGMLIDRCNSLI